MTLRFIKNAIFSTICLLLGACAQSPMHKDAGKVAQHCPAGTTLTCEANQIGRIRHGSFSKSNDRCACVQDGGRALNSPVIPSTL